MKHRSLPTIAAAGLVGLAACSDSSGPIAPASQPLAAAATPANSGVNVLLNTAISDAIVADLSKIGPVLDQIPEINALTMRATANEISAIKAKPYVAAAEMDSQAGRGPLPSAAAGSDYSGGMGSWDQDAIGVTVSPGLTGRNPDLGGLTGNGVWVVILDSGLLPTWRDYFPSDRVATQYARSFGGGGGDMGTISSQPEKWQNDTDSHGTHVTSTILGYTYSTGQTVNGTAPKATVIPVKVLNQNDSGWWSVISRGLIYAADLHAGELAGSPMVANMSIGGGRSVLVERAIDYAIGKGIIFVAAAGNEGASGMSWPGGYAPVISVAAYGWTREWLSCGGKDIIRTWWRTCDVSEPTRAADFYITDFSSREKAGQQLDISAPGSWVVGPYQANNGPNDWWFLGGTSMASPHVAGVAALMAEKNPALTQAQAEAILKQTAIPMGAGSVSVYDVNAGKYATVAWGADATGAGMVDAVAAVNNAFGGTTKRTR